MILRPITLTFLVIRTVTCLGIPPDASSLLKYYTKFEGGVSVDRQADGDIRFKRVTTNAAKGLAAVGKLLEGSTQLAPRSMRQRWFEKTGDFSDALEDFFSVRPNNVKIFSGHVTDGKGHVTKGKKTIDGKVGDRRIILRSDGVEANPVLEVIGGNGSGGSRVDVIIYKKDR